MTDLLQELSEAKDLPKTALHVLHDLKEQANELNRRTTNLVQDVLAVERFVKAGMTEQQRKLAPHTIAGQAELLLRSYGRPMTVKELVPLLRKRGVLRAKDGTNAVYVSLNREPEKFTRTAPGTYGLKEEM